MKVTVSFMGCLVPLEFNVADNKNFRKINEKGVYMIADIEGEIIYIGVSNNIGRRLGDHFRGQTQTKYFTHEMCVAIYYPESDKYERDALEKVLINQFRPKYNATTDDLRKGKLSYEDIQDIKWYLSKGKHSHAKLADAYNVSKDTIRNISCNRSYSSVQVSSEFTPFKIVEEDRKLIKKEVWHRVYLGVIKGHTLPQISNEVGIGLATIEQFFYSTPKYYKEIYEELEGKYGPI